MRLTTSMKQGLYAQIAECSASIDTMPKGASVSEEQAMLNKQKVELERLLSTKQMAKAMAEMKRYKKAPPAVVGVCCAAALLVRASRIHGAGVQVSLLTRGSRWTPTSWARLHRRGTRGVTAPRHWTSFDLPRPGCTLECPIQCASVPGRVVWKRVSNVV